MKMKMIHPKAKSLLGCALVLPLCGALGGCTRDHRFQPVDMWNKTRLKPYEAVAIPGGTTALPIPMGVVARGQLITAENEALHTGKLGGKLVTAFPFAVNEKVLQRGQERYTIYCAPCHGGLGDGKGQIVQRGFAKPPDYTEKRLVDAPVGHFFDVMTHGYGAMYSYAARVPVNDRWAIAAYIRLLQKTRGPGKRNIRIMPGGGRYPPDLKPTIMGEEAEGGHAAEHAEPAHGEEGVAPGVVPGSAALEKAEDSGSPNKSPEH